MKSCLYIYTKYYYYLCFLYFGVEAGICCNLVLSSQSFAAHAGQSNNDSKPRSPCAQAIVRALVDTGAAFNDRQGCHMAPDEAGLAELTGKGYVVEMGGMEDWYTFTQKAQQMVSHCVHVEKPVPIKEFIRPSNATTRTGMTCLELVAKLTNDGWVDVCTSSTTVKKIPPYKLGGAKQWFRKPRASIQKIYLEALLCSKELLEKGQVESLYHFQPKAYYHTLLVTRGAKPILPNQTLPYYKAMLCDLGAKQKRNNRKLKTEPACHPEHDIDEVGLTGGMGPFD